ncbi:MAG: glutamine--fructose-6-phosphate transaminase (isomerizing) [Lachnospiraceae bacterium]|nr:glutamine--fructose-6-phosphate transaminase (isomerizing) [Lachnospiraceae bacterium]
MCGIMGYVGKKQAGPVILDGLSRLEYRGYDSAGIAVRDDSGDVRIVKAAGKLKNLAEMTQNGSSLEGTCGLGHTRWATHGEPTQTNAHPHISLNEEEHSGAAVVPQVTGVHNGIIENYQELRIKLLRHGYRFYSDTDTEVLVKLVDYYYKKYKVGPIDALAKTMVRVQGSYALAVMFADYPGEIYTARKDSPMIIGVTEDETFVASDIPAILKYTQSIYYAENLEMARLIPGQAIFYDLNGDIVPKTPQIAEYSADSAEKGGYEFFMLKEIYEQPKAVRDTISAFTPDGEVDFSAEGLLPDDAKNVERLYIFACGSAYHAAVLSQYVFEELAGIPVRVEMASEFRYRAVPLEKNSLAIVISQSGETADSLAALRKAKEQVLKTLSIVNVSGSSIARESDYTLRTPAGPEIAVATTKAFSAQVIVLYLLALWIGSGKGRMDRERCREYLEEIRQIPEKIEEILSDKTKIQWLASKFSNAKEAFLIGRGIDYAVSMEGSLKVKEVSYIHSEAYAAGELKHGTISLLEKGTLVIGILTQKDLYEKTLSNLIECKARGAYIAALTGRGNSGIEETADFTMYVPETAQPFMGSLALIPLQLLGFYISIAKGLDPDKPRNLAKSVTVE